MNYEGAKSFILNKLQKELDPRLTYHSVAHTNDVLESAVRLAVMEKVSDEDLIILKTACLFHDSGMLVTYRGHEEASIRLSREVLPSFGYDIDSIESISRMIETTKLPQCASQLLDKILCDADLDYLGRPDFFMIAHRLKYEWDVLKIHPTTLQEWYKIQKDFLTVHKYFTASAMRLRQAFKLENLKQVEFMCNHEK
jgi:uncharacterized protein